jgi:hypothetical protein
VGFAHVESFMGGHDRALNLSGDAGGDDPLPVVCDIPRRRK